MATYGLEIIFETANQYRTIKFSTGNCTTPQEAEQELKQWLDSHPTLMGQKVNCDIRKIVFED